MRSNCAALDFLLHFFVKKKVESNKKKQKIEREEISDPLCNMTSPLLENTEN
jgi:hypothetical protein